ncbi:MAG: hypothetical protein HY812_08475 [Planctomycetes bacterium]|nr:hypothetical protein [Planctomycetota bacterium]
MKRILGLALALVFGFALFFFLPAADHGELAALSVYEMLTEETVPGPEGEVVLGSALLAGPALERTGEGRGRLLLGETVNHVPDAGQTTAAAQRGLRDALVRALLKVSADAGLALEIAGMEEPVAGGLCLRLERAEGGLRLFWRAPGEPEQSAFRSWSPARRDAILPPLVAIALAILLRRPIASLFAGVLVGAFLVRLAAGAAPLSSTALAPYDVFASFLWEQLKRTDRGQVIGFVIAMLAMVVFFDDYANTILVGGMMRPLADRFRVSREKLSYIIDSTSAPVAGLSIFSTWIAFEVSTFSAQLPLAGRSPDEGYAVFIETLPYRFYCIFTLILVGLVTFASRDLGPMLGAERRARRTGLLVRAGGKPMVGDVATAMEPAAGVLPRAWRALLPLAVFIAVTLYVILYSGQAFALPAAELFTTAGLSQVLGNADSYLALLIGSSAGLALAVLASLLAGMRREIVTAAWRTLRSTGIAIAILYLAWMIGDACVRLGTAQYLTVLLGDALNPLLLPIILFLLSSAVSFSTGTSWGTMSILLPIVVGLAYALGENSGQISGAQLVILSIGAVLEGSIFGDHCSPISDTTVLSSIAAASDHIDHVRTQAPYAVLCLVVAASAGYLPVAFLGWSPWTSIGLGSAVLAAVLFVFGKKVGENGAG